MTYNLHTCCKQTCLHHCRSCHLKVLLGQTRSPAAWLPEVSASAHVSTFKSKASKSRRSPGFCGTINYPKNIGLTCEEDHCWGFLISRHPLTLRLQQHGHLLAHRSFTSDASYWAYNIVLDYPLVASHSRGIIHAIDGPFSSTI